MSLLVLKKKDEQFLEVIPLPKVDIRSKKNSDYTLNLAWTSKRMELLCLLVCGFDGYIFLRPPFCHRFVCTNVRHPTYELGMQMTLLSTTPCAPPLLPPPSTSVPFQLQTQAQQLLGFGLWRRTRR